MIVGAGYQDEQAEKLAISLIRNKRIDDLSKIALRIACEQKLDYEKTLKLINIWNKLDEEYTDKDTLEVIYETFGNINGYQLFNNLIFSENISVLRHCSNQIRVIQTIDGLSKVPDLISISEENDTWIKDYPKDYHENLAKLNSLSESAEKIVRKIFMAHWWPKFFIKSELKKLYIHLNQCDASKRENIETRIIRLKNKLESHLPASEITQEKLQSKLVERIKKEQFNIWKNDLDKQFHQSWSTFLELPSEQLPDWLFNEKIIQFLLPIADFKSKSKSLAKLVIKQRCVSDDWQFKEHPKNQAFLNQLSQGGFDSKVWLDGIGEKSYIAKSSNEITIKVAFDPLDILNMGGHFKTCLSPGSFNYFSVFSNIADINKQVIYGRNSDGKVIGRVLIGLMPSGGVKVFNIYFHNANDEFKPQVMQYIKSWVKAAGFTLTDKGNIPKLVSSEWYDDGAIDVESSIECLNEGSRFRKQLKNIEPDLLEKKLIKALSPLPVNELTFPLVVRLPEITKRSELISSLIKIAQKIPRLGEYEIINLFRLAHDSQTGEQCYQAFRRELMNSLLRSIQNERWFDDELAYSMTSYNPSDALRIVKKYGNCWSGSWKDNLYLASARVAVKSLKKLGRKQQAEELAKQYKLEK